MAFRQFGAAAAVALTLAFRRVTRIAVTEIQWWHAMTGANNDVIVKLANDFNASQSDYKVVPTYKGGYADIMNAGIAAPRPSRGATRAATDEGNDSLTGTTDYDARRGAMGFAETETLGVRTLARADAQSPQVDPDDNDTAESAEPAGADLCGEELTMPVIPKRADEFTCTSCFLVHHRSRIAAAPGAPPVCRDCA